MTFVKYSADLRGWNSGMQMGSVGIRGENRAGSSGRWGVCVSVRACLCVSVCLQAYFAHEGDTISSCTHVSAERNKLPEKRMKGNMAKRKPWHGSKPGSRGYAKTAPIKVKNLIPVQGGLPHGAASTGEEGAGAQDWACRWGWRLWGGSPEASGWSSGLPLAQIVRRPLQV